MVTKYPATAAGVRYGRLVAAQKTAHRPQRWLFRCDCGTTKDIRLDDVRAGRTLSCGCLHREIVTGHGMSATAEYACWQQMRRRCSDPNSERWDDYGGRGIRVCDRWERSFEHFYADMGPRPSEEHSIERGDNDGNYEAGNCLWGTDKVQNNNMRRNIVVSYRGRSMTLAQACELAGLPYNTVWMRLYEGWTAQRALNTAVRRSVR